MRWRSLFLYARANGMLVSAFVVTSIVALSASAPADPAPGDQELAEPVGALLPRVACWERTGVLDEKADLDALRAAAAEAAAAGDELLVRYLEERIAELIGADPILALKVIDWAHVADDETMRILLAAVRESEAAQTDAVRSALLAMAEKHTDELHRAAALHALGSQKRFDAAELTRVKAIATRGGLEESLQAAKAIGEVMANDSKATGNFEAYTDALLDIAAASREEAVRLIAVEGNTYADPPLLADEVKRLADILMHDGAKAMREQAALVLSTAADRARVLAIYRQAFPLEADECVRWAIFRFSVRVAGETALPVLAELAARDARFAPDLEDFRRLYAAGVVDFERIWNAMPERHECIADPDEGPHGLEEP